MVCKYGKRQTCPTTLASNKIHLFLLVRVPMKYGKWQGSMASGSKIWDVKLSVKSKRNITNSMNIWKSVILHYMTGR